MEERRYSSTESLFDAFNIKPEAYDRLRLSSGDLGDFTTLDISPAEQTVFAGDDTWDELSAFPALALTNSPPVAEVPIKIEDEDVSDALPAVGDDWDLSLFPALDLFDNPTLAAEPESQEDATQSESVASPASPATEAAPSIKAEAVKFTAKHTGEAAAKTRRPRRKNLDAAALAELQEKRYQRRLLNNRKSAQASRDRKRNLKDTLQCEVQALQAVRQRASTEVAELEAENRALKEEFQRMQELVMRSHPLAQLVAQAAVQQSLAAQAAVSRYASQVAMVFFEKQRALWEKQQHSGAMVSAASVVA